MGDNVDPAEIELWQRVYAAAVGSLIVTDLTVEAKEAAEMADDAIDEFRKRFKNTSPYNGAPSWVRKASK